MEHQPFLNDDGEQVGWVVDADDGQTYVTELDGSLAGVWDDGAQGWQLFDEQADDDPLAAYEQRIAELERRVAEPPPRAELQVASAPPDLEMIGQDMLRQREQAEAMIGRSLTLREARLIGAEMLSDADAGREPDISAAIQRLELRGEQLHDLDDEDPRRAREARVAWMTERAADRERYAAAERGEDELASEQPPATRESYDLDDREQRQAWMADAMRGVTDPSALYSSTSDREALE